MLQTLKIFRERLFCVHVETDSKQPVKGRFVLEMRLMRMCFFLLL